MVPCHNLDRARAGRPSTPWIATTTHRTASPDPPSLLPTQPRGVPHPDQASSRCWQRRLDVTTPWTVARTARTATKTWLKASGLVDGFQWNEDSVVFGGLEEVAGFLYSVSGKVRTRCQRKMRCSEGFLDCCRLGGRS